MNILMLCTKVPFPANDGGALATMSMVSLLTQNGYKVTILAVNPPKHQVTNESFSPMEGVKIIPVEVNTNLKLIPMFLNFIFGTKPYVVIRFLNRLYKEKLKELIITEKFDIVQIEGSQLGIYLDVLSQIPGLRVIIRAHNVEWKLWQELSETQNLL
ncbi:MAG: glycosyltransferase family 4 protein [Bacteroidetes bacterium]|nr:glycosyltransferase family 4 protein [Bacteroidota bacterium]